MGKRGPAPKGKSNVVALRKNPDIVIEKPGAPFGMTRRARNLFRRIVDHNPRGTYDPEAVALLRAFCEMENQNFLAAKALAKEGPVSQMVVGWQKQDIDGYRAPLYKPMMNPWFNVQKESMSSLCSVSRTLKAKGIGTDVVKKKTATPGRKMFK